MLQGAYKVKNVYSFDNFRGQSTKHAQLGKVLQGTFSRLFELFIHGTRVCSIALHKMAGLNTVKLVWTILMNLIKKEKKPKDLKL